MREFKPSGNFFKGLKKHGISKPLLDVLQHLIAGEPLPKQYLDHPLKGDMNGYRECHVKPDLLLIYKLDGDKVKLVALDTHSELFD